MYLCIHVSCFIWERVFVRFLYTLVCLCVVLQPNTCMKKKKTRGRKLVLVDFPAKMLILTAKTLRTCVLLLSAFKMRRSATRPPISMWSVLPWPTEFPLCPLAIVSPAGPAPGLGTSIPQSAPCRQSCAALKTPVSPSPLHSILQTFFPECRHWLPLFPICIGSLSRCRGRHLCFLRSPVIAICCCRWSSPP